MFRKTLIATAAAAVLSAGAVAATTTAASAGPYGTDYGYEHPAASGGSFGYRGDDFYFKFGFGDDGWRWHKPRMHKVCGPTYKTVKVWQKYYGWVWKTVYAGEECRLVPNHKWDKHYPW
ncbi:MAG TPA: hypothetical protein VFB16_12900 [Bauldia sp.]|nr:hypothetical protein [Bauldia sp.]